VHSATKLVFMFHYRGAATLDDIDGRREFFLSIPRVWYIKI